MYRGVKLDIRVRDYASARAALEDRAKRSKVRAADVLDPDIRKEAPLGHPRSDVTGVRLLPDNSVAFRLYRTDVVVWHPDDRVSVTTYPSVTTGAFANALLPRGLRLGGASELMTFSKAAPEGHWQEWWDQAHVCNGDGTYRRVDGRWGPDEDTLVPMRMITMDRKVTRAVSREYPFARFRDWLFAATGMTTLVHEGVDYETCAEALKAGDFRKAAAHLPTMTVPRGWGVSRTVKRLAFENVRYDEPITLASIDKVRLHLYYEAGAIETHEVPTMTCAEHRRVTRIERELANASCWL